MPAAAAATGLCVVLCGLSLLAAPPLDAVAARNEIEAARAALAEGDVEGARRALARIDPAWGGAEPNEARDEIEARLAAAGDEIEEALALEAAREAAMERAPPSVDEARRAVEAVLAERQFREEKLEPETIELDSAESLYQRFVNWVLRRRATGDDEPSESWVPEWLAGVLRGLGKLPWEAIDWSALALAILLAILVVARHARQAAVSWPGGRRLVGAGADGIIAQALAHDAADLREAGVRLLERGDLRGALRAFYVAILSTLHRQRILTLDPAKTNWEHVRALGPAHAALRERLVPLTGLFDRVWYGRRAPVRAEVEDARAALDELSGTSDEAAA